MLSLVEIAGRRVQLMRSPTSCVASCVRVALLRQVAQEGAAVSSIPGLHGWLPRFSRSLLASHRMPCFYSCRLRPADDRGRGGTRRRSRARALAPSRNDGAYGRRCSISRRTAITPRLQKFLPQSTISSAGRRRSADGCSGITKRIWLCASTGSRTAVRRARATASATLQPVGARRRRWRRQGRG